jgi:hypothetical protein
MTTTFELVETSGTTYDCDCCGSYASVGKYISVNDKVVWEKYSDGHMHGHQTEDSIVVSVLDAWNELNVQIINENYTQQKRLDYNVKYPDNVVARDTVSWSEKKNEALKMLDEDYVEIKNQCKDVPYNEFIQLKMIALWIEGQTGEEIACSKSRDMIDD